ncbi:hypothetical protein BT96DRAFT_837835, partial [Gymnopus androsaceus JB14]
EWHPELDTYIQEMLQLEGCGLFTSRTQCSCGRDFEVDRINNLHCCCDCYMPELFCKDCMVNHHAYMPFHRLERWNSQFFEHCTLKNCGLILELGGHTKDKPCLMVSIASLENLTVVNKCGIQDITVCYCSCHHAGAQREQLLHARLWPATITNPKTAVTFDCLEHFQMLNLMTKTSGSEFYETLERLTDNTGMRVPAVSFSSLSAIAMLTQVFFSFSLVFESSCVLPNSCKPFVCTGDMEEPTIRMGVMIFKWAILLSLV